jgi:hypothetical protein
MSIAVDRRVDPPQRTWTEPKARRKVCTALVVTSAISVLLRFRVPRRERVSSGAASNAPNCSAATAGSVIRSFPASASRASRSASVCDAGGGGDGVHARLPVAVPGEHRVTVEEQEEVLAVMRRTASLDSVAFGAVGKDFGNPADGFTHSYLAAIPDLEALERYMHDPVHLRGDDLILDKLEQMSAVRFTDDTDPALGQAVYEIAARKMQQYPDSARRIDRLFGAHV